MAKKQVQGLLERTYTIPLRKEFRKVPNWKQTNKAVSAVRAFLEKHMKSEDVRLGKALNDKLWERGIRNPPHKIKVTAKRDDKGLVRVELFGVSLEEAKPKEKKKKTPKKEMKVAAEKSVATPLPA